MSDRAQFLAGLALAAAAVLVLTAPWWTLVAANLYLVYKLKEIHR